MNPTLSLVTGTVNRETAFLRLLDSIIRNTAVEWELIVSNASDQPYVLPILQCVKVLDERPRLGYTRGYNQAFQRTRGKWVIYLNDDAEVLPGYDEAAIGFMEAHAEIGLGCLYYSENGGPFHINSAWDVPYANFGILSREFGEKIDWLDPDIEMYGSDNALTFKVLLAGYGIAGIQSAKVLHHSVQDQVRIDNQHGRMRDNQTLHRKYFPLRHQWLSAYRRHRIDDERQIWPHGRPLAAMQ